MSFWVSCDRIYTWPYEDISTSMTNDPFLKVQWTQLMWSTIVLSYRYKTVIKSCQCNFYQVCVILETTLFQRPLCRVVQNAVILVYFPWKSQLLFLGKFFHWFDHNPMSASAMNWTESNLYGINIYHRNMKYCELENPISLLSQISILSNMLSFYIWRLIEFWFVNHPKFPTHT